MRSNIFALRLAGFLVLTAVFTTPAAAARLVLEIQDAQTREAAATRLSIIGDEGPLFAEPDSLLRSHLDERLEPYIYVEDRIELDLPAGDYLVRTAGGPTVIPREYAISLGEDGGTWTLPVEKWIEPRQWGWIGADPHVHLSHQGEENLPDHYPADVGVAGRAGRAEALDLLYLLENRAKTPSGVVDGIDQKDVLVLWGEEFRSGWWGHVVVLGAKELVTVDGNPWANGPGLSAWPLLQKVLLDASPPLVFQAHPHTGGTTVGAFHWPETGEARELPSLAVAGCLHGVATGSGSNFYPERWNPQPLLDGLEVGAHWASLGETDAVLSRQWLRPVGSLRTYAHINRPAPAAHSLLDRQWRRAVASGRSYATSGPILLDYRLNEAKMGEILLTAPGEATLHLHLASWTPLRRVTLLGASGRRIELPIDPSQLNDFNWEGPIDLPVDDALLVEAVADGDFWYSLPDSLHLVSSPIRVVVGTPHIPVAERARANVDALKEVWFNSVHFRHYDNPADSLAARTILLGSAQVWEDLVDDPPGPVQLIYPEAGRVIGSSGLRFLWHSAPNYDGDKLQYRLELAQDEAFSNAWSYEAGPDTSLVVEGLQAGSRYWWRVIAREDDGDVSPLAPNCSYFELSSEVVGTPAPTGPRFSLSPVRGAPGELWMALELSSERQVRLRWFDARGRLVRSYPPTVFTAGRHVLRWNGRDERGRTVAAGVYWLVADGGGEHRVRSSVLLRP